MRPFTIPAFPEVHAHIDLPDIAELLVQPMYRKIDADLFRATATSDQRAILDRAPLRNDRKYVSVECKVNLFHPVAVEARRDRPWHRDGHINLFEARPDTHHLLLSPCEVLTEFNTVERELQVADEMDARGLLEITNDGTHGFVGRKMPPNRFVTFRDHLHRPTDSRSSHHQLRYLYRIVETDHYPSTPAQNVPVVRQMLLQPDSDNHRLSRLNLERRRGSLVLHLPDDPYGDVINPTPREAAATAQV